MSITTYAELETAIASWLKRDDLTDSIPDFITLAEAQLNRDLMNMNPPPRAMEQTQTGTLTVTTTPPATLALPTGYIGTKRLQIQISGQYYKLTYKPDDQMAAYSASGRPRYFEGVGDNLEIAPPPDSAYTYAWNYYKKLDALASSSTNWLLTNHPDIYLYASLLQSAPFLKNDQRIITWGGIYKALLDSFEMANRKDRQSGSTLQMRSDVAF